MKSELLNQGDDLAQAMSALRDGETSPEQAKALCAAWSHDASLADDWQAWSLIGDVMRSEDMAAPIQADLDFLHALQRRLRQEPVLLAPESIAARTAAHAQPAVSEGLAAVGRISRRTTVRLTGGLLATGVMALAGFMAVGHLQPVSEAAAPGFAQATPAREDVQATPVSVLRNAELDRYLNAHRQFAQGPALAGPGGLRQVALTPDGR